jgi:DNA-binding transcriptional LysR family regulator
LKYIVAVAEAANITKASERLFLAQPSLSKQIKDLEEEIGFPIFVRRREGVCITPAGQMVVAYAQEALSTRDEILEIALAVHRGEVPPLRLGFSSFIKPSLVQLFRNLYARMFPECEIHLSGDERGNILERLEHGGLDGAFLSMPIEGTAWIVHEVSRDLLVVCMRADDPMTREPSVSLPVLATKLKIFRAPQTHLSAHNRLIEMLLDVGINPVFSYSAATPADIQWMVRAGYGVALVEQTSVIDPDLTTRPIAGVRWTADIAFVHHDKAEHPALRVATKILQKMRTTRPRKKALLPRKDMPLQLDLLA